MEEKLQSYLENVKTAKIECAEKIKEDVFSFMKEIFGKDLNDFPLTMFADDNVLIQGSGDEDEDEDEDKGWVERQAIEIINPHYSNNCEDATELDNSFLYLTPKGLFIHSESKYDFFEPSLECGEAPMEYYLRYAEDIFDGLHTAYVKKKQKPGN